MSDSPQSDPNRPERRDPDGRGPAGRPPPGNMKMSRGMMGWLLLGGLAVLLVVLLTSTQNQAERIPPDEFLKMASQGKFQRIVMESRRVVGTVQENATGEQVNARGGNRYFFSIHPDTHAYYLAKLDAAGQHPENDSDEPFLLPLLTMWGPLIIIALLLYFFVFRRLGSAGGGAGMLGSFGRSRHRVMTKEHSNVTLDDVAGIDEAKDELGEVIEFLKNPKRFQRLGGRVPRGVLLIGAPGCGKTLLAKAVAGEADVPFFSISGSDFVEMFVGVGASRVRDLFKQAKDSAPCIIFLDEIDAVGRRRGSGMSSGGHDEREQTLNAILVEMDGFESSDQVIVIAATNRADVLDPALIRPGRFDRQIHVSLPDIRGRMEILKVHSRRVKMSPDVDLERLARGTPMFSGADLAAIINEAAITATLQSKNFVEQSDLEEARDKVKWGRARKSHKIEEDEKRVIAYHEAGHAIVTYYTPDAEPLHKVTIIPRGPALGVTYHLPEKDRHIQTRRQLLAQMRITFGGRIAEEMFCDDISSGASMDIRQATAIARAMVTEFGMSEKLGFQLLGTDEARNTWEQPDRTYSDETARVIDEEVKTLIDAAYADTEQLLATRRDEADRLAGALLKYETLTHDEVRQIMDGEQLNKPTVSDLLEAERKKAAAAGEPESQAEGPAVGDDASGALPTPA